MAAYCFLVLGASRPAKTAPTQQYNNSQKSQENHITYLSCDQAYYHKGNKRAFCEEDNPDHFVNSFRHTLPQGNLTLLAHTKSR